MNENKIISIIIPIYKVEKYITKCIQSLLNQTYQNFEAILVDDGSTDASIEIAKKLIGHDQRFIFLEKVNGGQASARNLGLDYSTGDYIAFLDSDDYIKPEFLEKMLAVFIAQPNLDIVTCGYRQIDDDNNILWEIMPDPQRYYEHHDILFRHEYIDYSVCNKIYLRSVWEHQRFLEGIIYEDKEILPRLCYQKNIGGLREYLYFYVRRQGSTMNSYQLDRSVTSMVLVYQAFHDFLESVHIIDEYHDYYQEAYIKYCFYKHFYMILASSDKYDEDCKYLIEHIDNNIVSLANVKQYYGVLSKQFGILALFKCSPLLAKIALQMKLKLFSFLKK